MAVSTTDLAKFTRDGTIIEEKSTAIRDAHIDAIDASKDFQETFVNSITHAEALQAERWAILSTIDPFHEGIEVEQALDLGRAIPIAPRVPSFTVVDRSRNINTVARCRALAYDLDTERFAVELLE